jgi:hypothetical protein
MIRLDLRAVLEARRAVGAEVEVVAINAGAFQQRYLVAEPQSTAALRVRNSIRPLSSPHGRAERQTQHQP